MSRNSLVVAAVLSIVAMLGLTYRAKAGAPVTVEEVQSCELAERLTALDDEGHTIIAVTPLTVFDIYNRRFCLGCTTIPTCFVSNGSHVYTYNVAYR